MRAESSLKYVPALDGLRGVAILSVVIYHATSLLRGGWAGVDIFFVLSGYLITRILSAEIKRTGRIDLKAFYIKRLLRLAPAFCSLLLFSLVIMPFVTASLMPDVRPIIASGLYLMNWNKAFHWLPDSFLDHTWSLAIEEQFYILWPFCILFLAQKRRATTIVAVTAFIVLLWRTFLVLTGHDDARTYHAFDVRCDGLLIGCALALTTFAPETRRIAARYAFVPCVAMAIFMLGASPRHAWVQSIGLSLAPGLGGLILIAALNSELLKAILSNPVLVYTGRISYGWYLWHWPLLAIGRTYIKPFPGSGLCFVALAYVLAVISFHFLERPFLKLKVRLEPSRLIKSSVQEATPERT